MPYRQLSSPLARSRIIRRSQDAARAARRAWILQRTNKSTYAGAREFRRPDALGGDIGVVDKTRPLCLYPRVAVYTGSGDTNDAVNFVCRKTRHDGSRHGRDDDDD